MKLINSLLQLKPYYKDKVDLIYLKENHELIKILEKEISTIKGNEYYLALDSISDDFENDSYSILQDIANGKQKAFLKRNKGKEGAINYTNIYQKFISQFISLQKDIAKKAYISESRMSKILMQSHEDFYAYEIFTIAKSQNISCRAAFDQLYSKKAIEDFKQEKKVKLS